jgi:enoyl-CoA hydratase/carnithine racemase
MSEAVYAERAGAIATVVLNRPEKLNALDLPDWKRLGEIMQTLDAQEELRCVVIRGAGDRAFSAGADIAGFAENRATAAQVRGYGEALRVSIGGITDCRHPVIAAINGVCVGGGLEIASACDMRLCSASSRFGAPIHQLGLTMSYAELRLVKDAVGAAGALEILLEGEVFDAERALALGLVNRVVADAAVWEETDTLAARIASGAPLVNRWHKKFIRRLMDPAPLTAEEIDEGYAAFETEDYRIGYRAFLEKRKPVFKGR